MNKVGRLPWKKYSSEDICWIIRQLAKDLQGGGNNGVPMLAKEMGITAVYLWIVLEKRQDPGPAILEYLGLSKMMPGVYYPQRTAWVVWNNTGLTISKGTLP